MMNWNVEIEKEGSVHGPIEVLSQHLPRRTEENHEKLTQEAGAPAKFRIEYLLNTSLEG
jgi:hypothetical protein